MCVETNTSIRNRSKLWQTGVCVYFRRAEVFPQIWHTPNILDLRPRSGDHFYVRIKNDGLCSGFRWMRNVICCKASHYSRLYQLLLRLVRRNGTLPTDHFSVSGFLDKIDVLMPNAKFALEIDSWLGCERHSRTQQSVMVSLIEVR